MKILDHECGTVGFIVKKDNSLLFTSSVMTSGGMAYFQSHDLSEVAEAADKVSPGVVEKIRELIASAREWLCDCFPHDEDQIAECTEAQIIRAVNRYRDGGWADFVACNQ
jgi:hypothetical protein